MNAPRCLALLAMLGQAGAADGDGAVDGADGGAGDGEAAGAGDVYGVAAVAPPPLPAGPPPIAGRPRAAPPNSVLAWMVKMAVADGQVDDRERALLASTAARYGVPPDRLSAMLAAAAAGELDLPVPADADEARAQLAGMARAALADGRLSADEHQLLRAGGQRLGLTDHDVKQLLQRTKAEMFAEARAQLRTSKANGRAAGNGKG